MRARSPLAVLYAMLLAIILMGAFGLFLASTTAVGNARQLTDDEFLCVLRHSLKECLQRPAIKELDGPPHGTWVLILRFLPPDGSAARVYTIPNETLAACEAGRRKMLALGSRVVSWARCERRQET
jgi:hypothetical protein